MTMTIELTPAEGITVTTYRGESDGAPVVQIDTAAGAGWVRVNLNDGPPLFDGDPERHDAPGAFRGPSAPDSILTRTAPESAQQIADAVIAAGYADMETFEISLIAQAIDAHTVRALMAKAARAALATLATQAPGSTTPRAPTRATASGSATAPKTSPVSAATATPCSARSLLGTPPPSAAPSAPFPARSRVRHPADATA